MRCQRNSIDTVVSRLLQYKAIQARDTLTRPRIKEIIDGMVSGGLLIAEIGPRLTRSDGENYVWIDLDPTLN